jgi:hypothetical protein
MVHSALQEAELPGSLFCCCCCCCWCVTVPIAAGPGACFFLIELLLSRACTTTVKAESDAVLWVVPAQQLQELAASRPDLVLELGLKMSQVAIGVPMNII